MPADPAPLTARRNGPLAGRARVPGDKSISIRAILLGALAVGETRIDGMLEGEDVLNTANALRALGARIERTGERQWLVHGVGVGGFAEPASALDFGNSGTGCRLTLGAVAGCPITATFDGDASLRSRPMRRVLDPLERIGARALASAEGRLPLTLAGARDPMPIVFKLPVPSAQLKSATLLAGLSAPGETVVIEAEATRDHTEKMLRHFGADVRVEAEGHGRRITLTGQPELMPRPISVPADPSSAAFPLIAALLVPGSDVILPGVMMNPLRTGLIATLGEMGASIERLDERVEGGEDVADLRVRGGGGLRGVEVPASRAPSMIDEYPVLAVAAAFAEGTTVMRGLKELRVKESDRLAATAALLRGNGVAVDIEGDDLIVHGAARARGGGTVTTHMDHRIAMAAIVLGVASEKPVQIDDGTFIATSFPGFVELMRSLGAELT
jgi:3-phosphoshikimate 1-carboxyvinyltransferase